MGINKQSEHIQRTIHDESDEFHGRILVGIVH